MAFVGNPINFPQLSNKAVPLGADILLIADSADSNKLKQCLISTLPYAPSGGWLVSNVTGATQAMVKNTIYFVNYTGGACTLTIPAAASSAQGDMIWIQGGQAATNPFIIAQNALQSIYAIGNVTTVGVTGTITMTDNKGSILLRCDALTGGLTWTVVGGYGNFAGV